MATIIVVDDEQSILKANKYNLKEGHMIHFAYDSAGCMSQTRMQRPDLTVLYIMRPSVCGYDLCKRLRSENGDISVLFFNSARRRLCRQAV